MHDKCNRAGHPCSYWGENGEWLVAMGRHRDSDLLTNSNWDVFIAMLDKLDIEDAYTIESESHWAVGWVEHILINPQCQPAIDLADDVQRKLDDYPILDEDHHSEREWEDHLQNWESWGRNDLMRLLEKTFELGDVSQDRLSSWDGLLEWYDDKCGESYLNDMHIRVSHWGRDDVARLLWACHQTERSEGKDA